jgi:predicted nucleotidyltransferase
MKVEKMQAERMDIIENLRDHEQEIKKRFGIRRIGVFGSFARGEAQSS